MKRHSDRSLQTLMALSHSLMALPFFYIAAYNAEQQEVVLDEDNSRHAIQVLRMKTGDPLQLTDGKGA
jgi:16S rRNA (uracil1498-N3)-methyltransferase